MTLRGVRFTLCDCGQERAPTWELTSGNARVDGDRVALSWPVFRVTPRVLLIQHPVPVFVMPWISLPLTDRQTGLLFPEVGTRTVTGWGIGLPAFVTLGRSADLTATPEYFFGPKSPHQVGGSVKGPGARLELRWAPAVRAEGGVLFHVLDDQDQERPGGAGAGGLRLSIQGYHVHSLGPDTRLITRLNLSQDPYMFRDFRAAGLPQDAYYSRSDLLVSHRTGDWVLEGDAMYLEPLAVAQGSLVLRPSRFGWFGVQAPAPQRWPSAYADLLPVRLGPVQLQGRAGLTRYAPITGHRTEILPSDPAANPGAPREGASVAEGTVVVDPATGQVSIHALPREAVTRPDARLQLSVPTLVGDLVSLEPYLRGAALGYVFDASRGSSATAWGLAGLSASAELARRYRAFEHRIVPRLELLAGTAAWQANPGDPFPAYDAWDRIDRDRRAPVAGVADPQPVVQKLSAGPQGAYSQLRASIENRLDGGSGGSLAVQLGQDLDVRTGQLAETSASLVASKGPFAADAIARFLAFGGRPPVAQTWSPSWLDEFTRFRLAASIHDQRGDALRASLDSTGSGAVGAEGAGVDELFDLRPSGAWPDAWYSVGARVGLGGAGLDYTARFAARDMPSGSTTCTSGQRRTLHAGDVGGQTAVLTWDSPCHCFVARVLASLDACGDPSLGFDVDLSKILQGAARKGG
jgi:LPS-assembly protein